MTTRIKIGTRGSQLALWQANWVKSELEARHPGTTVDLLIIKTKGDKILDVPLARVGGKGLFVKEIEEAILDGRVDLAVHSMKDMPAEIPSGLTIGAVPRREVPNDILISKNDTPLDQLPQGARVGTSSLRRSAQLKNVRPDLTIVPLRGNLDTRIKKLHREDLDAIVLAAAGVRRLGLADQISEALSVTTMLPAVGQGALCIETRTDDPAIAALVAPLEHPDTRIAVTAERAFLHRLEGGCQVPIAGHAVVAGDEVTLTGLVADVDGKRVIRHRMTAATRRAAAVGVELAGNLLQQGADRLLETLKDEFARDNDS